MRNVALDDLYRFQWPTNPMFSPDGKHVVYEKTSVRQAENDYDTQLWMADVNGKNIRRLTTEGNANWSPVWSPDGKSIAYLSNGNQGNELWLYDLGQSEATMLMQFRQPLSAPTFAPDGKQVYALLPIQGKTEEQKDDAAGDEKREAPFERSYDTLYYKMDGVGFGKGFTNQLVAIDVETLAYRQITDVSSAIESFSVSPDGMSITFAMTDFAHNNPLFNGTLHHVNLTDGEVTLLFDRVKPVSPRYSPDGKWIAFIGGDIHQQLYIIPEKGGEARCLSPDYPGTFADMIFTDMNSWKPPWVPQWSEDSQYIHVLSGQEGSNEIVRFAVDPDETPETVVGGERAIFNFSYDGKGRIVVAYTSPGTPGRLSVMDVSQQETITRTYRKPTEPLSERVSFFPEAEMGLDDCNAALLSDMIVVEPEPFTYESTDGWQLHGFMIEPANRMPGETYPVILDIHGGPHSTHGYAYTHQFQLYSAMGYAVVYVNPRGSSGYGEAFTKAVIGEYGTKDMEDILNGLDAALEKYDFLDDNRIAVGGLSYGGFMTNWIVTHTNRFQVAISEGGISNWISMYGTSDISPGFIDREFADQTSMEELWNVSPLAFIEHIETPILVMHAEDDLRVPIEQGEQMYSFTKRQGVDTRFVRIPESSHVMLRIAPPAVRITRLQAMFEWLQMYLPTD